MSHQFDTYIDNQIQRAIPTHAPNDATGLYELPLADSVIKKGVDADNWTRHSPAANDISIFEGDVVCFVPNTAPHISWYVDEVAETQVTLSAVNSSSTGPITRDRDELTMTIEADRDRTTKIANRVTESEAEYLFGSPNQESDIAAKFADPSPKGDISDLVLTRERSAETVSKFINHPIVGHALGRNYTAKRITFGARYQSGDGSLAGVVDFTYPSAPELDGQALVEIKRFAAHPNRPANTGSWLISKAVEWAQLEAFERVISYSGVGGNAGVLYRALEFDDSAYTVEQSDGDGWTTAEGRDNRSTWDDYDRNRYDKQVLDSCPIHRRNVPESLRKSQQQGIDEFEAEDDAPPMSVTPTTAAGLSLSNPKSPLWFARRDNDVGLQVATVRHYGNQVVQGALSNTDVVFAADTSQGTVAALCAAVPEGDAGTIEIIGYGSAQPDGATNTAAILVAKLRNWAGLSGQTAITATPEPGTEFETALSQCGFSTHHQMDATSQGLNPALTE